MNNNECGVSKVMDILGGKWKLKILWVLSQHPSIRFTQLKREVDGITNVMLTRCLETLADVHLVKRTDYHEIPPKVDYALTDKGKELFPSLLFLNDWGKSNL
ncbi:helix-turn-helix transcriptional regulator [Enterococcus faecalis]|uniref:winged helix-turn-helix transcriptional regulator n=1 Tax=Enterococcus faecalis TaxID=1351 RepID=UPI002091C974|nr:helix-turn-helix domain-containing protein [Enterococcus faecalis]MCO5486743.1 helix-turn-helix transcriptional regulator [Enterococcus faecalis]HDV0789742.1 helix-turn-helix transcriptional regulator [Enterococcus faecalis]